MVKKNRYIITMKCLDLQEGRNMKKFQNYMQLLQNLCKFCGENDLKMTSHDIKDVTKKCYKKMGVMEDE